MRRLLLPILLLAAPALAAPGGNIAGQARVIAPGADVVAGALANLTDGAPKSECNLGDRRLPQSPQNVVLDFGHEVTVGRVVVRTVIAKQAIRLKDAALYAGAPAGWAGAAPLAEVRDNKEPIVAWEFPAVTTTRLRLRITDTGRSDHSFPVLTEIEVTPAPGEGRRLAASPIPGELGHERREVGLALGEPIPEAWRPDPERGYLGYVERFADTLLEKGVDRFGPKQTPMWCGVIDAYELTVPRDGVPAPPGVRESDRAVGGSNLYHDAVTLRAFQVLSALTGRPRYRDATRDYVRAYLEQCASPHTGLLAWGEHLTYDVYEDRVQRDNHELLEWTPPWDLLWEADPEATKQAIAGLRYHFFDQEKFLFNRHGAWRAQAYQKSGQPWIKHSALYCHAFLFLYRKTHDPEWLKWARGIGSLYWNARNPETNLTEGCLGDPRPTSRDAGTGIGLLSYWLLKAYHEQPEEKELRERALILMKAFDHYAYDPQRKGYRGSVHCDGTPVSDSLVAPWSIAYGSPDILRFGRAAAYIARTEKDADCLTIARHVADIARATPVPKGCTVEGIAFALNLSLDLYDQTGEAAYLDDAKRYADRAVADFWTGSLFTGVRQGQYYEAKLGIGDLLAGLLRLHLRTHPELKDPAIYDWSF